MAAGKETTSAGRQRAWPAAPALLRPSVRSSRNHLPECWLKELVFPELSYSPFSSNALDKHFELGAGGRGARSYFYGGIANHLSNVCFLQSGTQSCFLSLCRGTAHSYLYEEIMVIKSLFFSTEC